MEWKGEYTMIMCTIMLNVLEDIEIKLKMNKMRDDMHYLEM